MVSTNFYTYTHPTLIQFVSTCFNTVDKGGGGGGTSFNIAIQQNRRDVEDACPGLTMDGIENVSIQSIFSRYPLYMPL